MHYSKDIILSEYYNSHGHKIKQFSRLNKNNKLAILTKGISNNSDKYHIAQTIYTINGQQYKRNFVIPSNDVSQILSMSNSSLNLKNKKVKKPIKKTTKKKVKKVKKPTKKPIKKKVKKPTKKTVKKTIKKKVKKVKKPVKKTVKKK